MRLGVENCDVLQFAVGSVRVPWAYRRAKGCAGGGAQVTALGRFEIGVEY